MNNTHPFHFGIWLPFIIIAAILIFVFEVWMFVEVALHKQISDKAKTFWIIGMLLIHPFVAIVYFFTDHRKAN